MHSAIASEIFLILILHQNVFDGKGRDHFPDAGKMVDLVDDQSRHMSTSQMTTAKIAMTVRAATQSSNMLYARRRQRIQH